MDENKNINTALNEIAALKKKLQPKEIKRLQLELLERVLKRLADFGDECQQCKEYKATLEEQILNLNKSVDTSQTYDAKSYQSTLRVTLVHLQRKHKLITEGTYIGMYMSIGIALGMPLGLAMGNISIGLPIGMVIGMAIGSSFEADAKKKGLMI